MSLPWENSLAVLKLLSLVCSSDLPHGTLSTCLSDTPILGSGHVLLYPLDTVPTALRGLNLGRFLLLFSEALIKKCSVASWHRHYYTFLNKLFRLWYIYMFFMA